MSKITLTNLVNLQNETTAVNAINNNNATITAALDNTLSRDGTSPNTMGAALDMNSNHILNLPAPIGATDPVRLEDLTAVNGVITINAIPAGGTTGQSLQKTSNADFVVGWGNNVTSVGLALPTDFTVTNSPVTSTGTLTGAWAVTPTGTGAVVRATSPTLVTPALGTPASGVATNLTGTAAGLTAGNVTTNANLTGDVTSVGNATTLATVNTVTPGSYGSATVTPVITVNGKGLVTASAGTTITPAVGSITGLGTNVATFLATPTSANLAAALTNETGSGAAVFGTSPTLTTPVISSIVNTGTLTLPTSSDTLIGKATTDTLTNKTFDTSGTGNVLKVGGVTVTAGQYPAVSAATAATAGNIGEYIESVVLFAGAFGITSNVATNVTSISLTAGDWDVSAMTYFIGAGTTSFTNVVSGVSLTTGTLDATAGRLAQTQGAAFVPAAGAPYSSSLPPYRFSLGSTTTIFLVGLATFTVSTATMYGIVRARRIH